MKAIIYTNIILTVIMLCLIVNILERHNIIPSANAEVKTNSVIDVNIKQVNGRSFYGDKLPITTSHN